MVDPELSQGSGFELQVTGEQERQRRVRRLILTLVASLTVLGSGFTVWVVILAWQESTPQQPVHGTDLHWAILVIEQIEVRESDPPVRYDRQEFGPAWSRITEAGCDVRSAMLLRDLSESTLLDRCTIEYGVLRDPYSGKRVEYTWDSGGDAVQVDHIVSLSDAWKSGAWEWEPDDRQIFANHSVNLLVVSAQQNQEKSSHAADQWLPADRSYHCMFVVRQILVKDMFGLSVTEAELDAYRAVLPKCRGGAT